MESTRQEDKVEGASPSLEGPMTRGRLKKIQEEVLQKFTMLRGRNPVRTLSASKALLKVTSCKGQWKGHVMVVDPRVSSIGNQSFQLSSSSWIQVEKFSKMKNSMKLWANYKRVNAKVEALSKGKEERLKIASMHESERSYGGDNFSESGGRMKRSWSSIGERRERDVRLERNRREERRERHGKKGGEPGEEELDMSKDLHVKLQRLHQGLYSIEQYHKEMEMDLLRARIKESEEATMAWFPHGLKRETQDVVELDDSYLRHLKRT
ncbi:hypothetical protein CR513_02677, partial [Mucuna pruriens]